MLHWSRATFPRDEQRVSIRWWRCDASEGVVMKLLSTLRRRFADFLQREKLDAELDEE